MKNRLLVAVGLLLWGLDVLTAYTGVSATDSSDYWFWVVIALAILFGRVEIGSASTFGRAVRWTGE